jgi:hypothetical protein
MFKVSLSISTNDIYNITSDEDILHYYFGVNKIPCLINSPLRIDRNPSFRLFYGQNNRIYFIDFSNKDKGNVINLIMKYFKLNNYQQAIDKIFNEIDLIGNYYKTSDNKLKTLSQTSSFNKTQIVNTERSVSDLKVKIRSWKPFDLQYWGQYGIGLETLKFGDVYPVTTIFIYKKPASIKKINADKFSYVYVENKDNVQSYKVYQPLNKSYKWLSKHDGSVWDLWSKLPEKGKNLIITSSRKDALCIWNNLNIPSISLQSETHLPKPQVVKQLKDRFQNVYILYDNDPTGIEYGKKLSNQYNLIYTEIPKTLGVKDPSDLFKLYGKQNFLTIINSLFNNNGLQKERQLTLNF